MQDGNTHWGGAQMAEIGLYAVFVKGSDKVLAYDQKFEEVKGAINLFQESYQEVDPQTSKEVLKFRPMQVKVNTRCFNCLEFLRFNSLEELSAWIKQGKSKAAQEPGKNHGPNG